MNKVLRIGILLLLVAGIATAILYREQFDAAALESWVKDAGSAGPVVFMLIYVMGTVFFLPGEEVRPRARARRRPYAGLGG